MLEVEDRRARIKKLFDENHVTFSDCVRAFQASEADNPYIEFARNTIAFDNDMEIDSPTVVSETDDGTWVMMWMFVKSRDLWEGPVDTDDEPCRIVNHYECQACHETWTDQWSCACNDRCPSCNREIEPHESTYLDILGNPEP
jgi:hypothetical protein